MTAPQPPTATPRRPPTERWLIANGPWRDRKSKPSPREGKRIQQGARKRDKERQHPVYGLRSTGQTRGDSEEEE